MSGFRSPWSLSNRDDKTENGVDSLFRGGGGKLVSRSTDGALIGVGYGGFDPEEDMVVVEKIHVPEMRNDFGQRARLDARDEDSQGHLISAVGLGRLG